MTFDETVLDYANKAQSKMIEFIDVIHDQLKSGHESPKELEHTIELLDFHESLLSDVNPWTEEETEYWIAYFLAKYDMVEIPWVDQDIFVMPVTVVGSPSDGSNYATISDLAGTRADLETKDLELESRIEDLEADNSSVIPQSLIDDVASSKTTVTQHTAQINQIIADQNADETDLTNHKADTTKHIQPGEREAWNTKVSSASLTSILTGFAAKVHGHSVSEIIGLSGTLNSLQSQINNLPAPEDGQDGQTPVITIGTVTHGLIPSVSLAPGSTVLNPILNFTLVKGDKGDGFQLDKTDDLSQRSLYNNQPVGYTFLAQDTGDMYVLLAPGVWSDPVPFVGNNGWTPKLALYEQNADRVLLEVTGFFGGSGTEPELDGGTEVSPRFFLANGGYTTIADNAINIKGRQGADGLPGRAFIIDQEGTNRVAYDSQLKGFTFLNSTSGKISWKLSDTPSDWSAEHQWRGPGFLGEVANVNANLVYSGPASGGAALPAFRALVMADLPGTGTRDATTVLHGDGIWKVPAGGGGGVTDGDKGDIVVSGTGASWVIDSAVSKNWTAAHSFPKVRVGGTGAEPATITGDNTTIKGDNTVVKGDNTASFANLLPIYSSADKLIFGVGQRNAEHWIAINLGGDNDGDIYYRKYGALTRLPIGSRGQLLTIDPFGNPIWGSFVDGSLIINFWKTDADFRITNPVKITNIDAANVDYRFTNGDYIMDSRMAGGEIFFKVDGVLSFGERINSGVYVFRGEKVYLRSATTSGETIFSVSQKDKVIMSSTDTSFQGIQYGSDFSLNFTNFSLIHKGFADLNYWKVSGNTALKGDVTITVADPLEGEPANDFGIIFGTDLVPLKTFQVSSKGYWFKDITGAGIYLTSYAGGSIEFDAEDNSIRFGTKVTTGSTHYNSMSLTKDIGMGLHITNSSGTENVLNTVGYALRLKRTTANGSIPTAGIGTGIEFDVKNGVSGAGNALPGTIKYTLTNVIQDAEEGEFIFSPIKAGAVTDMFYITGQGIGLPVAPLNDNALTQVLVRDVTSGLIKYRDASTFGGGGSPGGISGEIQKNAAGSFGGAGLLSVSAGNLQFGLATLAGSTRTISAEGSAANIALWLKTKGSGRIEIGNALGRAWFEDFNDKISLASGFPIVLNSNSIYVGTSNINNTAFFNSAYTSWQAGEGVIFIGNRFASPIGNPTNGIFLYVEGGSLKMRGSSGTITVLGLA